MTEHVLAAIRGVSRNSMADALLAGLCLGVVAQVLRQMEGEAMELGAATAPWLTVGFALAVTAAPRRAGGSVLAAYLFAWLVAYHVLYAVGQSVPIAAAAREAVPWLLLAPLVCVVLAPAAGLARTRGIAGDVSLAAPIAWSLPEALENAQRGDAVVAAAIGVLAFLPVVASGRRDIRLVTFVLAMLALGALALAVGPIVRSQIHS